MRAMATPVEAEPMAEAVMRRYWYHTLTPPAQPALCREPEAEQDIRLTRTVEGAATLLRHHRPQLEAPEV
jgi:hypothetical protein